MFDLLPPDDENIGKYLTDVVGALIRDDNRKHRIALAKELAERGNVNNACK